MVIGWVGMPGMAYFEVLRGLSVMLRSYLTDMLCSP